MTTVLITGPTGGLGREATLAMAARPDMTLFLVGRRGTGLTAIAEEARARGAEVHEIACDLAQLADVRAVAVAVGDQLGGDRLDALIANAGTMSPDTRTASADGYELTFAVNYLAHAQLIASLDRLLAKGARVVLLGSNTYHANFWRKLLSVPAAEWHDPTDIAQPATGAVKPGLKASGVAYSNAKLALLYYAHELQRRAGDRINVVVFEPGWMPGTGLGRDAPPAAQAIARGLGKLPGVSTPKRSGPALASVALDRKWENLRDGAFVVKNRVTEVQPEAVDPERERRLWEATRQLLKV